MQRRLDRTEVGQIRALQQAVGERRPLQPGVAEVGRAEPALLEFGERGRTPGKVGFDESEPAVDGFVG